METCLAVLGCTYHDQFGDHRLGKQVIVGSRQFSRSWTSIIFAASVLLSSQFSFAHSRVPAKAKHLKSAQGIVKNSKTLHFMSTSKSTEIKIENSQKSDSSSSFPPIREDFSAQNAKISNQGADKLWAITRNEKGESVYLMPRQEQKLIGPITPTQSEAINTLFQAAPIDTPEHKNPEQSEQWNRFIETACTAHNNGDYNKAKTSLQSAIPLTDDELEQATLYAAIGEISWETKQKKDALESYNTAAKLVPEQFQLRYVQLLVLTGKREDAISALESSTENSIPRSQQTFLLGTLYEELGDYDHALKYLGEAAALDPNSVDVLYNLGLACELSGQNEKAHAEYQAALKIQPTDEELKKAVLRTKKQ